MTAQLLPYTTCTQEVISQVALSNRIPCFPILPTFIATGSLNLFVDEDIDYAHRLLTAGIPVDLLVINGFTHGFDFFSTDIPEVKHFREIRKQAIKAMHK